MELPLNLQQSLARSVPGHRAAPGQVGTSVVADRAFLRRQSFQQPPAKTDQLRARYLHATK